MSNIDTLLQQLIHSAEVAKNIEAEAKRKADIAETQRKAMDRSRTYA